MIFKQNHVRQNEFKSEKPIPKYYYTTHEVAKLLNVAESAIRFWTKEFKIYKKVTTYKENWMFPRNSVAKLHHIKKLRREEKYTLEGTKLRLKLIE